MKKTIDTMQELADALGLSRQTLSKYFNNPRAIGQKTRRRIETVVEDSGFRPNLFATSLKKNTSRIIGIVIPSMVDPFYMQLVAAIDRIAAAAGYFTITLSSNGSRRIESGALERLRQIHVAGALIVALGKRAPRADLARFAERIPVVYLDNPPARAAPFVGSDNRQSVSMMVDYLCRKGRPPAFLCMPPVNGNAGERETAYLEAMEKHSLEPELIALRHKRGWTFEAYGYRRILEWLRAPRVRDCLLCANDRLAHGALRAAWEEKISVGTDNAGLLVAGHDDHPLSAYTCPPLTSAAQNAERITREALRMLLAAIAEGKPIVPASRLIQAKLVARHSA